VPEDNKCHNLDTILNAKIGELTIIQTKTPGFTFDYENGVITLQQNGHNHPRIPRTVRTWHVPFKSKPIDDEIIRFMLKREYERLGKPRWLVVYDAWTTYNSDLDIHTQFIRCSWITDYSIQRADARDLTWYAFIDDEREVPEELQYLYCRRDWTIVKNNQEFAQRLSELGIPEVVSFDFYLYNGKSTLESMTLLVDAIMKKVLSLQEGETFVLPIVLVHTDSPQGQKLLSQIWEMQSKQLLATGKVIAEPDRYKPLFGDDGR